MNEQHAVISVITMILTQKVACEKALCSSLTVANAVDVWSLAELHSARHLESQAIDFISSHIDQVKATEGWKNMLRQNPAVALVVNIAKQQVRTPGRLSAIMDGIGWFLLA